MEKISGGMEKIQQAIIRLSVPKGSFALDEELGSKLSMLGKVPVSQREELALEYARECHFTSGRGRGDISAMQAG